MATINNISFYRGEDIALVFTMSPVTNITGWTITFSLRNNPNDADPALITVTATLTTPISGIFTVSLPHAQTLLAPGNYAYDVQRSDSGSATVLSIGDITIVQEVLYP